MRFALVHPPESTAHSLEMVRRDGLRPDEDCWLAEVSVGGEPQHLTPFAALYAGATPTMLRKVRE
ncbi:MAG: hypothetical protein HY302_04800 [Opitutae bacterium]|nr:hypothetical protein [Opitutae bacterium]